MAPLLNTGEAQDLRDRMRAVEAKAASNEGAISTHEEICVERYKAIHHTIAALGNGIKLNVALVVAVLIGEVLGWKQGFIAVVKILGLVP